MQEIYCNYYFKTNINGENENNMPQRNSKKEAKDVFNDGLTFYLW